MDCNYYTKLTGKQGNCYTCANWQQTKCKVEKKLNNKTEIVHEPVKQAGRFVLK